MGSKSRPGREYALVQYIGYGSFAEVCTSILIYLFNENE